MKGPCHRHRRGREGPGRPTLRAGEQEGTRQECEASAPGLRELGKPLGVRGGIRASGFCSEMLLWLRVEDGPRAECGSREMRREAVAVTRGLMDGAQTSSGGRKTRLGAWVCV